MILITPPTIANHWTRSLNGLFAAGVRRLHLRLPEGSEQDYRAVLRAVAPQYHDRIIVCDHYHLVEEYGLGGVYLPFRRVSDYSHLSLRSYHTIAVGAHSIDELRSLPFVPTYALLSPIYNSISKRGYSGNDALLNIKSTLRDLPFPVVALGGITPENYEQALRAGYSDVAVLGGVWQSSAPLSAFAQYPRPALLSIAGVDPTNGAGIGADQRVAQDFSVRCYAVPGCVTVQSAEQFVEARPLPDSYIRSAISTLHSTHPVAVAKIGMVTSVEQLRSIVSLLRSFGVRTIVWDSILKASESNCATLTVRDDIVSLISGIDMITPNYLEAEQLFGSTEIEELQRIAQQTKCSILLKGGHSHSDTHTVSNYLITAREIVPYRTHRHSRSIHGTGCMLSSAIAALLATGYSLEQAVATATHYVASIFSQSGTAIADHLVSPIQKRRERCQAAFTLQYITNSTDKETILAKATDYLQGGGRWIQLRMKLATTEERIDVGLSLRQICAEYRALLIIDDDVDAVLAVGADGVHLGQNDLSPIEARRRLGDDYIIGYTVNNEGAVPMALRADIDYVGVGPYRTTQTKTNLSSVIGAKGIDLLASTIKEEKHRHSLHTPLVVAIGGIEAEDVPDIYTHCSTSVDGIAVSGAIERASDIRQETAKLLDALSSSNSSYFI